MDSREIYAALFDPRGPAGEPTGEWMYVGDAQSFNEQKFASFIQQLDPTQPVLVAVSRTNAREVPMNMLATVVPELLELGEVRMADTHFRRFMQVAPVGVARAWSGRAQQAAAGDAGDPRA